MNITKQHEARSYAAGVRLALRNKTIEELPEMYDVEAATRGYADTAAAQKNIETA